MDTPFLVLLTYLPLLDYPLRFFFYAGLGALMAAALPRHYRVRKVLTLLASPAAACVRFLTPRAIPSWGILPLTLFWLYILRGALFIGLTLAGRAPV